METAITDGAQKNGALIWVIFPSIDTNTDRYPVLVNGRTALVVLVRIILGEQGRYNILFKSGLHLQ